MTDQKPEQTAYCPSCEHQITPEKQRAASMLAGTVVVVERCPGCEAVLRTTTA